MPGWTHPAIGTPTKVSINLKGKKIARGATLWPVGTWALTAEFYANLRKEGRKAGQETDPPGYCHFATWLDEPYFRHITSKYLKTVTFRGRSTRIWQDAGPDHLLDCRVYAMAMAEYLGLTRLTPERWLLLEQERGVPAEFQVPDLLAPDSVKIAAAGPQRPPLLTKRSQPPESQRHDETPLPSGRDWLPRGSLL